MGKYECKGGLQTYFGSHIIRKKSIGKRICTTKLKGCLALSENVNVAHACVNVGMCVVT